MSTRTTARRLTASVGTIQMPILTRSGINRALKQLKSRYGADLSGVHGSEMSQHDRNIVVQEILRVAQARYAIGLEPFYAIEPDAEESVIGSLPTAYLSDAEVLALHSLVKATGEAEGWAETEWG